MCYKIPGRTFDPWKDKTVMRRNIELRNVLIRGEDKFQYGGRTDIFMSSNTNMG